MRAQGGSRQAAAAARTGQSTARGLVSFLTDVAAQGFDSAARRLGLERFIGAEPAELLNVLVDVIAPEGALLEEAVARKALADTLSTLIDATPTDGQPLVDALDPTSIVNVLREYVSRYISCRLLQNLGQRLASGDLDPADAVRLEQDVENFVRQTVEFTFDEAALDLDWNGAEARGLIEQVFVDAHQLLEEEE